MDGNLLGIQLILDKDCYKQVVESICTSMNRSTHYVQVAAPMSSESIFFKPLSKIQNIKKSGSLKLNKKNISFGTIVRALIKIKGIRFMIILFLRTITMKLFQKKHKSVFMHT